MNYQRPISRRKAINIMIALTILAWATQTLLAQWGFSAELPHRAEAERFVPSEHTRFGAALELRTESSIIGAEATLRQVCRWSDADKAFFEPLADLVLVRIGAADPFRSLSVVELRDLLTGAGVNVASINIVGAVSCTISRSDVEYDEQRALQQWVGASSMAAGAAVGATTDSGVLATTAGMSESGAAPTEPVAAESATRTLGDALILDAAHRLNLDPESLQITFRAQDEKVLRLSEPLFRFFIEPLRVRNLGDMAWSVTVVTDTSNQKLTLTASGRAWQQQAVITKPLGQRQLIGEGDVVERRVLVDRLADEPLVLMSQAVGQQAARELKPGTVLTSRMLDPVQVVRRGQLVAVTVARGAVSVKTVGRALEDGTMGQSIRVRNDTTKDMYDVIVTGPQTAAMSNGSEGVAAAATSRK